MARIIIGGKFNNQIVITGNWKYMPAHLRGIVNAYFNNWGTLKDIAAFKGLMNELGEARAGKHFPDTDWEKLHDFYISQINRLSVVLSGVRSGGQPRFRYTVDSDHPPRAIAALLTDFCEPDGLLRDNFDLWRLDKLLRRASAKLKTERSFLVALQEFGSDAISFEESASFFRQIQAYHSDRHLRPDLKQILDPAIDSVHTLHIPEALPDLAAKLKAAGASLRLHHTVEPVIEHYIHLRSLALSEAVAAEASDNVNAVLSGKLKAKLYPFQREGVAFLALNRRALLADDMGLGKTLQAMSAALYLKQQIGLKRVLVICPASLKYQWQSEIHRFTSERCEVIGGDKAERDAIYAAAGKSGGFIAPEDRPLFYAVNYELVYRDLDKLKKLAPDLIVVDEAQRIKNFRTKTNKAVIELPAPCAFVLTGTPLENQLMELFTIMRFIDERALGKNPVAFRDRYVVTDRFGGITGYRLVDEVTRKIASHTLRRTKDQALEDLPALVEQNRWLELTDVQRRIYRELNNQARDLLSESAWDKAQSNNAMVLLQRLREVCDTPELIDPEYTESGKLTELLAIVEDEVGTLDRQVLIFTQWTRVGEILVRELTQAGYAPSFLHGGLKAQERNRLVDRFQQGDDRVFISTDAGGVGLNLQGASLVVNYDMPFNPAKLNQRISRAHRLGQKNTVVAVNLLCLNTVEFRLVQIIKEKQALFDEVFGDISDPSLATAPAQRTMRELLNELLR